MSYFEFIDRVKRTDYYIRSEATGNAVEFATKLGVSRRSVFDYLNVIKAKGAEICFDKRRKTFYYKKPFRLNF
ncbi:MAG TPA: DNA-binding protein [Bacteroidia bacterium]|nr:DNA-binding protein [Bacteroidia bacterium]